MSFFQAHGILLFLIDELKRKIIVLFIDLLFTQVFKSGYVKLATYPEGFVGLKFLRCSHIILIGISVRG